MDRRPPAPEPAAVQAPPAELSSQERAEHDYRRIQGRVCELARQARTMGDAATVAEYVGVLKVHRPRTYDVVSSSDASGTDYREHGFATADGGFVGLEDPRVLCEDHDDLTDWPCPEFSALTAALESQPRVLV